MRRVRFDCTSRLSRAESTPRVDVAESFGRETKHFFGVSVDMQRRPFPVDELFWKSRANCSRDWNQRKPRKAPRKETKGTHPRMGCFFLVFLSNRQKGCPHMPSKKHTHTHISWGNFPIPSRYPSFQKPSKKQEGPKIENQL